MLTTKQKVYLRSLAQTEKPIFQIGKDGLSENLIETVKNGIRKRELIKINVLKNCMDDPNQLAATLAERTKSEVVQVIGRKIVLFRQNQEKSKIEFPGKKRK